MENNRKRYKVFVVDDQSKNLQLAAHVLSEKYELILLNTGRNLVSIAREKKPDIILLDIMMPEVSGLDACRSLKKEKDTREIPVIFLTAKTTEEDLEKAYEVGAVDYITKPFRPKELQARIDSHISLKNVIKNNKELNLTLQANIEQKDKMLSIISHDLRGSAARIASLVDLLIYDNDSQKEDNPMLTQQLDMLKSASSHSRELLEDLLLWSRNQFNGLEYKPGKINVSQTLRHITKQVSALASSKDINIQTICNESLEIDADKNMFETIFRNLFSNAIKFSFENSAVEVTVVKKGDKVQFSVKDYGVGMEEEVVEKLFTSEKMKSEKGTQGEAGTGLGLTLCKEFVEKHGGIIEVSSEPGKGSTFVITM